MQDGFCGRRPPSTEVANGHGRATATATETETATATGIATATATATVVIVIVTAPATVAIGTVIVTVTAVEGLAAELYYSLTCRARGANCGRAACWILNGPGN